MFMHDIMSIRNTQVGYLLSVLLDVNNSTRHDLPRFARCTELVSLLCPVITCNPTNTEKSLVRDIWMEEAILWYAVLEKANTECSI